LPSANCLLILAAVQANQGELGEAQTTMVRLLAANPKFSLAPNGTIAGSATRRSWRLKRQRQQSG